MENALSPFEGKQLRKLWHNEQWYFSIVDVIEVLTDSPKPSNYWNMLKKREFQLSTICVKLKLLGQDGKNYPSDCANTEGVLRIVMSVPSPKAEPLKLWLAQVGTERIQETENPELLTERQAELYRAKGYPEEWISRRVQTIETRNQLTAEWKNRGVKEGQEYGILTATIAKGTFGLTPSEHSDLKGLEKQNLRDHMTPMELILTAFSEEATRLITIREEAKGFNENYDAALAGGKLGGESRTRLENRLGEPVVSSSNFLNLIENKGNSKELPEEG
jgi:DNA-damage-inducible protein D